MGPWVSRWGKISRTTVCWCPVLGIRGVPLCPAALTAAFTAFYSVFCRYNRPDSRLQPFREPARKRPPASFAPSCSNRCFYNVLKRVLLLQSSDSRVPGASWKTTSSIPWGKISAPTYLYAFYRHGTQKTTLRLLRTGLRTGSPPKFAKNWFCPRGFVFSLRHDFCPRGFVFPLLRFCPWFAV